MPSSGLLSLGAPPSRPHRNTSRVGVELLNTLIRGALKGFGLLLRDREMVPHPPPGVVCKGYRGRDTGAKNWTAGLIPKLDLVS